MKHCVGAAIALFLSTACVTSGTYDAMVADNAKKQKALQQQNTDLTADLDGAKTRAGDLDNKLIDALRQNSQLVTKVKSMGQNVDTLLGEKDSLSQERARLDREVAELRKMRAAAEKRNSEYKNLLKKLHSMIDAGDLEVKIRKGQMVVSMSSDVLFSPGRASLKNAAKEAIEELAVTIASFPERKFQVVGHSDATPIATARFPSNWELSSQRAIEVVKVMVNAGVPPEMLSAAGAAAFDPIAPNDTKENMAHNRRVELIFLPKIDELPGFDEVLKN